MGRNRRWPSHKKRYLLAGPRDEVQRVTDGSYDRKRTSTLSGVGWIIFCQHTGKRLVGSFWEKSLSASSYRAELLGLCSLHLLAQALSEFYKVSGWKATLCCDNLRALQLSSQERRHASNPVPHALISTIASSQQRTPSQDASNTNM